MFGKIVIVRGAGDLATGTIYKLHRCGFRVLALELPNPTAIRRQVAFSEAVYDGKIEVEGVTACLVSNRDEMEAAWQAGQVPVAVDPEGSWICELMPGVVVDAMVAKRNLGTSREMAPCTVALGPGFAAGRDVDVVIETSRGHDLGRLIFEGEALADTGMPGSIGGYAKERVIYAPASGIVELLKEIGDQVRAGEIIARVDGVPVVTEITGLLRGILRDGSRIRQGIKMADVDPRVSEKENCRRISDKARNIAGGVLEAILYLNREKRVGIMTENQ